MWIVDSGSCFDIVGSQALSMKDKARIRSTQDGAIMQNANGVVSENRKLGMLVKAIKKNVYAIVMDKCPNVLSLGHL